MTHRITRRHVNTGIGAALISAFCGVAIDQSAYLRMGWTGRNAGLGLSITHDIIVKQHSGSIEVDTRPSKYTEIRIILPRKAALMV